MPTVVDSLIVTLGLDPKGFTQGQKAAAAALVRTRKEAEQQAKLIEAAGNRASEFFSKLTKTALGLTAVFLGGRGIKEFAEYVTNTDAHVGRLSRTLGVSTKELSAWGKAVESAGGSTEEGIGAIAGFIRQISEATLTGEGSILPLLRGLNVSLEGIIDKNGGVKNVTELMLRLADAFSKLTPQQASVFGSQLGLNEATMGLLIRGRDYVRNIVEEKSKSLATTNEEARAAEVLLQRYRDILQVFENFGRTTFYKVLDRLATLLETFTKSGYKFSMDVPKGAERPQFFYGEKLKSFWEWMTGGEGQKDTGKKVSEVLGAPPGGTASPGSLLRTKSSAGSSNLATAALAQMLQSDLPGFNRVTSFNDAYHAGTGSAHAAGRALDFTLKDPNQSALTAALLRKKLAAMGIDASVLDEYNNPSKGATAGHIHVQFNSAAAAERFGHGVSNNSSHEVHVGTINVQTQATDAEGISKDIGGAIRRNSFAIQSNSGLE